MGEVPGRDGEPGRAAAVGGEEHHHDRLTVSPGNTQGEEEDDVFLEFSAGRREKKY